MGCFQSTEAPQVRKPAAPAAPPSKAPPASNVVPAAVPPVPTPAAPPRQKIVITEVDKAKHKLKNQRDVLERGVRESEALVARDMKIARELLANGQRESAKVLIRRKRLVEKRVAMSVAQLDTVENSLSTIEGAEMTEEVLQAVEGGTKALNELHKSVTVERAEKVMQESDDAQAYTDEVSRALGLIDDAPAADDAEVLADLAEFEKEHSIAQPAPVEVPSEQPEKVPAEEARPAVAQPEPAAAEVDEATPMASKPVSEAAAMPPSDANNPASVEEDEEDEEEDVVEVAAPKKRVAVPA